MFSSTMSLLLRRTYSSSAPLKSAYYTIYKQSDVQKIVQTFKKLTQDINFRRRTSFYEHTVQRLSNSKSFNLIEEILEDQKKYNEITDEGFTVRLLNLYGKYGMFDHAHKLFDEMPELKCNRTVMSFNALLGACVNSKKFDKIEGFFRELPEKLLIKRNVVSYNTMIKGLCSMNSYDSAMLLVGEMDKEGLKPNVITFNILLDAFYKSRRFSDGEKVWDMMEQSDVIPDIMSYNARLYGLVNERKMQEAMEFVQGMMSKGLELDEFTYNFLFEGLCSDGKYIEDVKTWYDVMMKTKCPPTRLIFARLIMFACNNNDFKFASRVCRALFYRRFRLDRVSLQPVIDGLVKQSYVAEAELLVRLGQESKHSCYRKLRMPRFDQ